MIDLKEIPVTFGPDQSLVGMVASPVGDDGLPVACLMLNSGAHHRVGPRRINVKLARQLAEHGISSIRFDLSGHGDSDRVRGASNLQNQAIQDLRAAMDVVESVLGIRRFLVIGLSSGAGHGLALSLVDSRVIGLFMFDGPSFPDRRVLWERSTRRAMAVLADPTVLGKTARWLQRQLSASAATASMNPLLYETGEPEVSAALFRRSMTQVSEQAIAVLLFYSGSFNAVDRSRDQLALFASEPFMRHIEYHFDAKVDRGLTSVAAQRIFMAVVCDWALRVTHARIGPARERRSESDFIQLTTVF